MHRSGGIWQLPIKIFIDITSSMGKIVFKIINIHHVVVNEGTTIEILWLKVKAYVVPVCWPNLIVRVESVAEVLWHRKWEMLGFKQRHFSFKVLVLTSVILTKVKNVVSLHMHICSSLQYAQY